MTSWTDTLPKPFGKGLPVPDDMRCPRCKGTGSILVRGMTQPARCPRCQGQGRVAK
jgi:DnaJ-class molecular chaperone